MVSMVILITKVFIKLLQLLMHKNIIWMITKPELYVFAPNGVTDKQGYPNSGCTCTESSLRKSLIDIYDEKLEGPQSVQKVSKFMPTCKKYFESNSQVPVEK